MEVMDMSRCMRKAERMAREAAGLAYQCLDEMNALIAYCRKRGLGDKAAKDVDEASALADAADYLMPIVWMAEQLAIDLGNEAECLSLGLSLKRPVSSEMVDEQAMQDELDLEECFK